MKNTLARDAIWALLDRFPEAGSHTLAAIAIKENPLLFKDKEVARDSIRYYRGVRGDKNRAECANKDRFRKGNTGNPFGAIPQSTNPFDHEWTQFVIPGPLKALILSDIHLPFHDRNALLAALNAGKQFGADLVVLNGDTIDCHAVSKWEKDPRKRNFPNELSVTDDFLFTLRENFPKARIIFKHGNHEERWESYMRCKAPECLGVEEFNLANLLHLAQHGIEEVREKRLIKVGQLNVLHGHEYRFAISNPVNPARGLFLRAKAHALCGHFHQKSEHSEKTVDGRNIGTWSTGCLCNLHQDYAPYNNWSTGFALSSVASDGKFEMLNRFIGSDGRVY